MITVLTAAYNGSAYIKQQLDSILAQSQDGILLVVSDDCSTDGTAELLDRYEKEYEQKRGLEQGQQHKQAHGQKVLVLHRKQASGGAANHFLELLKLMGDLRETEARKEEVWETEAWKEAIPILGHWKLNEGKMKGLIKAASSEYFMLSDQDDVWLKEKAGLLLQKMKETEAKAVEEKVIESKVAEAGASKGKAIGEREKGRGQKGKGSPSIPVLVHSDLRVVDENLNTIAPSFFAYQGISPERRRLSQLLVQNNVTGGAVMLNGTMLSYLRQIPGVCLMHDAWLALVASAFGRIEWVDQPLYLYRQHGSNTLGAEKGDSAEGIEKRLKDGSEARENYRRMFGQAASMLELFQDQLTEEQKKLLKVFAGLGKRSRLEKMVLILQYGFTKNTWLRTLGQMLFMGE